MPLAEVSRRQRAMYNHRADVLYDAPDSRVGSNFLHEVSQRCVPMLTNQTQPPKSGRSSWTRKCFQAGYGAEVAKAVLAKSKSGASNGEAEDDEV